jgi:hypothetical protein
LSGFSAGYFAGRVIGLPNVPIGSNAIAQVRAWDATKGGSYEEARGLGGRFGKSELMTVTLTMFPVQLRDLHSFSLQAGRMQFPSGEITVVEQEPDGTVTLGHTGEPGYRYLIERSVEGFEWRPLKVITNTLSTVTFTDQTASGAQAVFYRSRILD